MKNIEKCVAMTICKKLPIEWMRFNMYVEEDIYRNIPVLVFRVEENCSTNIINNLIRCVEEFDGAVKWKVFKDPLSKNKNYMLAISELEMMRNAYREKRKVYNEKEYFGIEKYMEYCECAVDDIPILAKYIDERM